jgi:hypothetical protein
MSAWEADGKSSDWYTPRFIFDAMAVGFDLDVAAPREGPRYVPCKEWLSTGGLSLPWRGFVFMNPPYGPRNGIAPWLDRFFSHGWGVALTPDRTSAPWWQDACRKADAVLFIAGKVKFERPDGSVGESPGNGSVLMAAGSSGVFALHNAQANNLGLVMRRSPIRPRMPHP